MYLELGDEIIRMVRIKNNNHYVIISIAIPPSGKGKETLC